MFPRLVWESFARQRRRKLLAGIAILLGTTAVTAMLALATTIGDRIHRELAVYGANIVVTPKADTLDVKVGGVDLKPATGGAYLKESDLEKLKGIFWANNITGVSPELTFQMRAFDYGTGTVSVGEAWKKATPVTAVGYWFNHEFHGLKTGGPQLHPWWKLRGEWPQENRNQEHCETPVVLGARLANRLHANIGDQFLFFATDDSNLIPLMCPPFVVVGIVTAGDKTDDSILMTLREAAMAADTPYHDYQRPDGTWVFGTAISRVEIAARTKPEDAFARQNPDTMSPAKRDVWYCRPYANSIAYQIREAIPGADAEQVRRVEQSEGTVLERISGLMWLISGAALLAAGFAVSAAMATAVLERRGEIGLMRSLGASQGAIATLFYAESGLLAVIAGTAGYLAGSALAWWLGAKIFPGDGAQPLLNWVLLPVVVAMALVVAVAGSTPSIRKALRADPSATLREDA